jgi:cobalamin biosynthesis Mg chelatase CobN
MDSKLNTSGSGGSLGSTSSPQASTSGNIGASTSNLQSINADNLLNSSNSNGIALSSSGVSTVKLPSTHTQTSTSKPAEVAKSKHHISAGLLIVVIVLFVVAFGIFWRIFTSQNNTTDY